MHGLRKMIPLLMCFALAPPAGAQEDSWEALVGAGQAAFQAGAYDEASEKFDAALRIAEGFSDLDTRLATTLNNIAAVHYKQGDYATAEPLFRRALSIRERSLGPDHVEVATSLNNLAALHRKQGDLAAAVPALERALDIRERTLGPTHASTLAVVENLAALHRDLGEDAQSEALLRQSLARRRQADQSQPAKEAEILQRLADIQLDQGRYSEATETLNTLLTVQRQAGTRVAGTEAQLAALRDMMRSDDAVTVKSTTATPTGASIDRPAAARQVASQKDDFVPAPGAGSASPVAVNPSVRKTALAGFPGAVGTDRETDAAVIPKHTADAKAGTSGVEPADDQQTVDTPRFFLQLISLQSQDRVQAEWVRLQDAYAGVLGGLGAAVVRADLGDHGVWYRLQAGPLTGFDVASAACNSLGESDQTCLVVER